VQRDAYGPGQDKRRPESFEDVGPNMSYRPPTGETAEQDSAYRVEAIGEAMTLGGEAAEIAILFAQIEAAAPRHTGTMRAGHLAARERVTSDADKHLPGTPADLRILMGVLLFGLYMFAPSGMSLGLGAVVQAPGLLDSLHGLAKAPPPRRPVDLANVERLTKLLPLLAALDRIDGEAGLLRSSARDLADDQSAAIGRLGMGYPGDPHGGFNVLRAVQDFAPRFRREARRIRSDGAVLLGNVEAAASGFDPVEEYRRVLTFGAEGFMRDLQKHGDDRVVFSYARRYIKDKLEPEFASSHFSDIMAPQPRSTPNTLDRLKWFHHWQNSIDRSEGTPQYIVGVPLSR
jgi:hypothetical protein